MKTSPNSQASGKRDKKKKRKSDLQRQYHLHTLKIMLDLWTFAKLNVLLFERSFHLAIENWGD